MKKINNMVNKDNIQDVLSLSTFISENKKSGKLSLELSNKIKELWDKYKLPEIADDCTIIEADFGILGFLIIFDIIKADTSTKLNYKSGSYDIISISCNKKTILWTDYKNIEPYNRQCSLYAHGASFEYLGEPVLKKSDYREFNASSIRPSNICFGVWGFDYNDFYGSVRFGICLKKENVDKFISELRILINK